MKQVSNRLLSAFLTAVIILTMLPLGAFTASAYSAGDIITFGSYPQTKVTDPSLIDALSAQTLGADSTVTYGGSKYKRVFFTQYTPMRSFLPPSTDPELSVQDDNGYYINTVYWFRYEPIQWRILSAENGELFVMAEKILGSEAYNQELQNFAWETCTLRSWLNNDFYNDAFSSAEKAQVLTTAVAINEEDPDSDMINDKVFLLSGEVVNTAYGFSAKIDDYDTARQAQGSDYAKSRGLFVRPDGAYSGNSFWWLRGPGGDHDFTVLVYDAGNIFLYYNFNYTYIGVRPAIKLNLSSVIFTSKTGSTCVVNDINGFIYGLKPGITKDQFESGYVQVNSGYSLEYSTESIGTGTVVSVKNNSTGDTVVRYAVVIYGDVNGDGNIDAADADTCVDVQNWITTWNHDTQGGCYKAGDVNGDGNIDSIDADIMTEVANYRMRIDQTTGMAYLG